MSASRTLAVSLSVSTFALALSLGAAACGSTVQPAGPDPVPPSGGGGNASSSVTVTITSAGLNPKAITASKGSTVVFVNNDSVTHVPSSNPHPVHTDCPEINLGSLAPGQTKATQALNTARTCGFHDHNDPTNDKFKGTLTVQ
jgi:plastocyanin